MNARQDIRVLAAIAAALLLAGCAFTPSPGGASKPQRAVVLGGGGLIGMVWELGVLKGFADAGIELSQADLLVGTSAGSIIGAQLASGRTAAELLAAQLAPSGAGSQNQRTPEDNKSFEDTSRMWGPAATDVAARVALGRRTLETPHPISEDTQKAIWKRRLGIDDWPARALKVSAVDISDGSIRLFDAGQGVPIEAAVAASTAQPGLQAPITIGDRRYMDGGVAGTHIDGALGYPIVVAITPFAGSLKTAQELELVRSKGSQVIDIVADQDARAAMGPNLFDPSRIRPTADAGERQAAAAAAELRKLWKGSR